MGVVLARIDDRLIHGQVTVGWCQRIGPDRIVLANNSIAADSWQSSVYRSSVPPDIKVSILSIAETVSHLKAPEALREKSLLLTASVQDMAELVRLGAPVAQVNLGGLHFSAGKHEMLPFVFVDQMDLKGLARLHELGAELTAQQVPGGRRFLVTADRIADMEVGL